MVLAAWDEFWTKWRLKKDRRESVGRAKTKPVTATRTKISRMLDGLRWEDAMSEKLAEFVVDMQDEPSPAQ